MNDREVICMSDIISVRDLTKKYGELTAVDNISFSVREGDLFAFLGPNGAGKSTTINIICTLLAKNAGTVTVDDLAVGKQDDAIRRKIGILFQDNILDDLLSVKENLLSRGGLYGLTGKDLRDRMQKICGIMGIGDILNRRYGKLSGGQKRRVEIARALMSDPKILFLDEPTTGLDPQTRINVWETIRRLQTDLNMTVFLTTHYMEEAASADMVAIIDYGKIVAQGTPNELKALHSTDLLKIAPLDIPDISEKLTAMNRRYEQVADMLNIPVSDSLDAFALLKALDGEFSAFEVVRGNMDDVFINITGRRIREDS
jgi:multidrug/hemolysin transport system ATP-binding protein